MTRLRANGTRAGRSPRALVAVVLSGVIAGIMMVGCITAPIAMDTPDGFARFTESDVIRAISPEGVLLRARTVPNDPEQSLEFWAEALERQLSDSGYLLVERADLAIDSSDAVLMEWLAPVGQDDWIYLTAISVIERQIAVIEAAGPTDLYEAYRSAIRESLESLLLASPQS